MEHAHPVPARRVLGLAPPCVLAAMVFAVGSGFGCGSTEKPTKSATYTLPASVTSLKVGGKAGEVGVTAKGGASQIEVVEKRSDNAEPSHVVNGSSGTLEYDCSGASCRVDYDITVPSATSLSVDNTAGKITLDGPLIDVVAEARAGEIKGTGLGGGSFTASTDAGAINLAFAGAPKLVKTTTKAGATTIAVPGSATYQVDASATVGDTDVSVPSDPSTSNRIEAKTDVGQITIEKG